MEPYKLLEDDILQISNGKVLKKRQSRPISILLILAGVALMILNTNRFSLMESGTVTTILFFAGVALFIWGIVALFVKKEYYTHIESGKKLKKHALEFDSQEFDKMNRLYGNSLFKEMSTLKKNSQASGLILKLIGTEDGSIYFSQVLKYVPYSFVPTEQGRMHEGKTSEEIKELIMSYHNK